MSQEAVGILPTDELDRIIGHQIPDTWKLDIVEHIIEENAKYGSLWTAVFAFDAGRIIGIREERARRNKSRTEATK